MNQSTAERPSRAHADGKLAHQAHPVMLNRAAVLCAVLFVACIPLVAANFKIHRDPDADGPLAGDFAQEYLGGYVVLHGDYLRFYDPDYAYALEHDPGIMGMNFGASHFLPLIYPPFYYLLVSPLAWLPYYTAAVTWLFLMAGCLFFAVWLLARAYPGHRLLPTCCLLTAFFFVPLLQNLCGGQKATVVLLILTGTFLLLDRRRPLLAGVVFGLLAFKPQLTLVIGVAMLCKRQGWFVLGGTITGSLLVGLSLLLGSSVCAQYVEISRTMAEYINRPGFPLEQMHCWYGFWKSLLAGQDLSQIQLATLLADGVVVALLVQLLRGPLAYGQRAFHVQFSAMVIATVLVSPHLLTYDLAILLLPFFLLTHVLLGAARPDSCLGWALGVSYVLAAISTSVAQRTHVQLSVLCLFVLLLVLCRYRGADRRLVGLQELADGS
jgi:hypothetical protein